MLTLVSLVIVGCSNSAEKNQKKLDDVQVGDSRTGEGGDSMKEVEKKLGKPDETFQRDMVGFSLVTYVYHDFLGEDLNVTVDFSNGNVALIKEHYKDFRKE